MRTGRTTLKAILALLAALTIAVPATASIPQPSPELGSIGLDRAELLSLLEPTESDVEPPCISERHDLFGENASEADPLAISFFTSALDHFALEIEPPAASLLEVHTHIEAIALLDVPSRLRLFARSQNLTSGSLGIGDRSNVRAPQELGSILRWGVDNKAAPFIEPATGLVYLRARWYDPGTGTFLTPDPLGYRDSSNLYAYAAGDPVNRHDPTGLESIGIYQRQRDLRSLSPATRESERLIRQESRQAMVDALANPYVQGSLQVVGGCSEAVIGGV
ncbi:MAG: RHS repeat-associated core domain-containing protein, partial [Acidobacteria bacterium]|nr:RHS repeat-associated core domain-containing protein [Acidobacteriota bacterium]